MPKPRNDGVDDVEGRIAEEEEQERPEEQETPEDKILKMLLDELEEEGDTTDEEELPEGEEEQPIDTDEKFITPDMIELPPKWFYLKVKEANLPKGIRLTDNMKRILDLVYLQGVSKRRLISDYKIASSTISTAFSRIRKLWAMHMAGTLNIEAPVEAKKKAESQRASGSATARELSLSSKTTTFKEIDLAISKFLAPQIERSAQFQDVMARIGMMTTYALMQLGIVDRTQFVALAEAVAADPENLYRYVASNLSSLISIVDVDQLKEFTKELMKLRERNRLLESRLVELEEDLARHKMWLHEAGLILSYIMDRLPKTEKLRVLEMMYKYEKIRQMQRGGVIAKEQGS